MLVKITLTLSICLVLSTITLSSPIMVAFNILIVSILLSVALSMSMSPWYALLMFLIYIGGMMIMFSYFIALSPNQTLKVKQYLKVLSMTMFFLIPYISFIMANVLINNQEIKTYELYSMNMKPITILLIMILLMMLLVIVKLVKISKGPLRPFKYV